MHVNPSDRFETQRPPQQSEDCFEPPVSIGEPAVEAPVPERRNCVCRALTSAGRFAFGPFRKIRLALAGRWCREELKIYLRRLSDAELSSIGITRAGIDAAVKTAFPSLPLFGRTKPGDSSVSPILDGAKLLHEAAGRDVPGGRRPKF